MLQERDQGPEKDLSLRWRCHPAHGIALIRIVLSRADLAVAPQLAHRLKPRHLEDSPTEVEASPELVQLHLVASDAADEAVPEVSIRIEVAGRVVVIVERAEDHEFSPASYRFSEAEPPRDHEDRYALGSFYRKSIVPTCPPHEEASAANLAPAAS